MKMPNMANGRDGFPCALNPVGDIFQRGTLPFETEASIDLGDASQEKKVLVGQIADSAASPRPFRREMRFWREMPKDLYHLYQMNKLDCISEAYTGTGHLSICTKPVPTCTTYTQGKASSELVKAATHKAKGNSRSQSPFFLAGPLSLIFSSVKVTASDSAEVTVSMTSEDYANLSSPESGSAKYRQRRSTKPGVTVTSRCVINGLAPVHMVGVCADNLLNRKAESAFVQAAGKEKGPAVSQALLSTSVISCTGESNELHHNSYLQATGNLSYSRHQHPNKTGAGPASLNSRADRISRSKVRFFYVRFQRCAPIMVGRNGGASALAGFSTTGLAAPIRLATLPASGLVRLQNLSREATTMATTQTRPEFIDTYWIIPEYETTPYGKVSFTRQDRRTFNSLFKDSRLIWAGRQPVNCFTENVKRTESQKQDVKHTRSPKECLKDPESQKVDVKRSVNPTSSVKETESCRGQSVSDIVTQGGVKITPPSTITEIVTVQGVAHV